MTHDKSANVLHNFATPRIELESRKGSEKDDVEALTKKSKSALRNRDRNKKSFRT